jgi:hypothetical protein
MQALMAMAADGSSMSLTKFTGVMQNRQCAC